MDPINQPSGKSNKGLYIVIGVLVLIIISVLIRQSFGRTRNINVGGYNAEVTRNSDGSTTIKSDYGTATSGGNALPNNWPPDAPMYANATITTSMNLDSQYSGTQGSTVVFSTSDNVENVVDFYKRELVSKGWTVAGSDSTVGINTVVTAKKDSRIFSALITNGSKVNVVVSTSTIPSNSDITDSSVAIREGQTKSILANMRAQGELFYATHGNSYKGYCSSKDSNGASELATKFPQGTAYKCYDAGSSWAAGAEVTTGAWCVDSTGFTGNTNALPKATSCIH